ncbi:tyrosine/serine/threonine protein phosphatase pps1 [Cryptotrichosporon argae]
MAVSLHLAPQAQPAWANPLHRRTPTPEPSTSRIRAGGLVPTRSLSHGADGQAISAPPTPVTSTHLMPCGERMERCRSSEAVLGRTALDMQLGNRSADRLGRERHRDDDRGGRDRDVKPLLFAPLAPVTTHAHDAPSLSDIGRVEEITERADAEKEEADDKMDIDEAVAETHVPLAADHVVWGMPEWGREPDRPQVAPGVRLVGMDELPSLIDQHSMLDTPSQVLFPWLHGIDDDGQKGRDMAAFFNHYPPFEPPAYRGLSVLLVPSHVLDMSHPANDHVQAAQPVEQPHVRVRSDTTSTTFSTSSDPPSLVPDSPSAASTLSVPDTPETPDMDVAMHPCEAKRVAPMTKEAPQAPPSVASDTDSIVSADERPSCILMNALHIEDIFDLPRPGRAATPRFRPVRLPPQINLRNLHCQQVKYATISDLVIYTKHGVGPGLLKVAAKIAQAQDNLYRQRMAEFYAHVTSRGQGEGLDRPVRYGVWIVVEPFHRIEKFCPQLVNIDSNGLTTPNSDLIDLFEREANESRAMTRATEVLEDFWVGNDCDLPGAADDGAGNRIPFALYLRASEMCDMPSTAHLQSAYRHVLHLRDDVPSRASPATLALRSLLVPSPSTTPDVGSKRVASPDGSSRKQRPRGEREYVTIDCAGSCRTATGQMRSVNVMADRVVELVYFIRKVIEGKDRAGSRRKVLVHCQDGYTESSIVVLSYIMGALGLSLPDAYIYLHSTARRSFFLYPSDKPLLRRVEAKLAADRRDRAIKSVRAPTGLAPGSPQTSPTSKWRSWAVFRSPERRERLLPDGPRTGDEASDVDAARDVLREDGLSDSLGLVTAKLWFDDRRFEGFPSRILPFLYLGNLEHAGNALMLHAIGVTHVVSVGENLIDCPDDIDPMYGHVGPNCLANEARKGRIAVLDLADIRDDGNDPLRPLIARACAWIEQARHNGGTVLVHCRVGVSRSASIVIAYLMQYQRMGLMDAYLLTRARRLNVLIQPNLRFFHELFGWEVELARRDDEELAERRRQAEHAGVRSSTALDLLDDRRRPLYTWPAFCRDVHCLNRRFLCN